ncbi:hypothetical protein [Bordetella petrii]|uniref:hypothetical protein n=1 Tax=Bordetella petrii TaxID=94624 RepID=UPI001E5A87D6|nr:hypothetical protein [Bordetella petrii]MCD0505452.1 hypothetical protein [Bordetella petrii]
MKPASGDALRRSDEIRSALRELMHPDSRVQVSATGSRPEAATCEARILGPDWQLRHFFWRPREAGALETHLRPAFANHSVVLDFTGLTAARTHIRFRVSSPMVLRFADSSTAMLSSFPDLIWYEPEIPAGQN